MKESNSPSPVQPAHRSDPAVRELVLQAQAGSREAYLSLLSKYRPLLESSVARFGSAEMTDQERADMQEEAERVFLGAVSTFDAEQDGVDLGLYAKICLRNGLISEWRHLMALRRMAALPLGEELTGNGQWSACRSSSRHSRRSRRPASASDRTVDPVRPPKGAAHPASSPA